MPNYWSSIKTGLSYSGDIFAFIISIFLDIENWIWNRIWFITVYWGIFFTLEEAKLQANSRHSPKFLDLRFDRRLNWKSHIGQLKNICRRVINSLKSIAWNKWGADGNAPHHETPPPRRKTPTFTIVDAWPPSLRILVYLFSGCG